MKILYVVHSFPPFHWRGAEVYAMELSAAVSALADARVFYLADDPAARGVVLEADAFEGRPVYRARMRIDPTDPARYFFNPEQEARFLELLADFKPEAVHFIYFAGGLSVTLPTRAQNFGAKVFITCVDFAGICPRGQLLDRTGQVCAGPREGLRCMACLFDKKLIEGHSRIDGALRERLPPRLVAVAGRPELALIRRRLEAVRADFAAARLVIYPNPNTQLRHHRAWVRGRAERVMDYGIDLSRFEGHRKRRAEAPRIAFIGQLLPHKGLATLAEAVSSLPEIKTLICHGSIDEPEAQEYIRSLGRRRDKIDFRRTFPLAEMNRVLEGIDLLVVPSQWDENCPLIVKYALATGTRALLADQPGIVASRPGLARVRFFDPHDALALRGAIKETIAELKAGGDVFSLAKVIESGALIDIRDQARELLNIYRE